MTQYGTIITNIGLAQIANAQVTQQKVGLQYIALGDGNGGHYVPTANQSALVNEVWRGPVSNVTIDPANDKRIIIEGIIPPTAGGFTIREIAVFDDQNQLIAVGQYPEKYKPQLSEGVSEETLIHFVIETNNVDAVELAIDPTIIIASREYVDERVGEVSTDLENVQQQVTEHLDKVESKLTDVITHSHYYVDVVNGSDDNDGKTKATAWKTLYYAGTQLSYKRIVSHTHAITLNVEPGTYSNDTLFLAMIERILVVFNNVKMTTPRAPSEVSYNSNVYINGIGRLTLIGDLEILANSSNLDNSKAYYPFYLEDVRGGYMANTIVLDGNNINVANTLHSESYGVVAMNSMLDLRINIKNMAHGVVSGQSSVVFPNGATFNNVTRVTAHTGGIISNHASATMPSVRINNDSGLYINAVNNGIVVESGNNANGSYIKYANGTLMCYHTLFLGEQTANTLYATQWLLPATFVIQPMAFANVRYGSSNGSFEGVCRVMQNSTASVLVQHRPNMTQSYYASCFAIGRWK
ncbi:phage tail protein [Metasolibacillus meyeri]|uniref:phage tail protein n=1 Tax=Metasolibacillus meyeri TaxID=1071052 RepID=UPI000D31932A|nr:phage tail protein [Metasolibacillus meyeri]